MGKVVNIYDDLPTAKIGKSDMFRLIVTNEYISGEAKYTPTYLTWKNRCKLLFSCNNLPEVPKNTGDEFWRRWILLGCFTEFKDKNKMTYEDEQNPNIKEKNPNILEEICTPEEFSGLQNKVREAWIRLAKRKGFPKEWDDVERVKGLWQMDIEPCRAFVDEHCEIGEGNNVNYYVFLEKLNEFRVSKNVKTIGQTMCTQSLGRINNKIERGKDRSTRAKSTYIWIRIKEDSDYHPSKTEIKQLSLATNPSKLDKYLETESKDREEN